MQTPDFRRVLAVLTLASWLVACAGSSDNPYSSLKDAPLISGRLHAVTLVTDDAAFSQALAKKGFTTLAFNANYPASDRVEASLWSVPEPVVAKVMHLKAPGAGVPDVRVLVMELAAKGRSADAATDKAFFANVLGSKVPALPEGIEAANGVRIQVWTYLIPSVIEANKRLRANGIPVVFDPVAITTAYLGDHKTMAIRAPDGTIIELVERYCHRYVMRGRCPADDLVDAWSATGRLVPAPEAVGAGAP